MFNGIVPIIKMKPIKKENEVVWEVDRDCECGSIMAIALPDGQWICECGRPVVFKSVPEET